MSRNLLDQETSPYLLQHRTNPVHWRPWGPAALEAARSANKPILLSIGYAACHWCHVMAHESFEDETTAQLINELYVPIKVDREERPDLDMIYQSALAMLGQQGGWPLTMFLTSDGEPFWGGTYFPPTPRYGRPGFRDVLVGVAATYDGEMDKVAANVAALKEGLLRHAHPEGGTAPAVEDLDHAAQSLLSLFDTVEGGLAGAPKFPQVPLFVLLWRAALRTGDQRLRAAVTLTLDRMSHGGIYDHLGGGYARYATDERWLVPHFEKMLYDNAQMIELLTLVWQDVGTPLYAERVAETIAWVKREMLAENDAFAATLDADSDGEEGKYYVWRAEEIDRLLPSDLVEPFKQAYDVTPEGNWEGNNILHRNHPQPRSGALFEEQLAKARKILLQARHARIPPARDDKVLADWNGMMIAAIAKAAFAFDRPDWLALAERAFAAIRDRCSRGNRLAHSLRRGRLQAEAMLDDYAQMARAALALYEAGGNPDYLDQAAALVDVVDRHYWDEDLGGYFFTADDSTDLIVRSKAAHDLATPAGNGVMVEVLARLYHLTGNEAYRQRAEDIVTIFAGDLSRGFPTMATLLNGWEFLNTAAQVVIVGRSDDARRGSLLRALATISLPNLMLTVLDADRPLPVGHPASGKAPQADGAPTAYVCRGPICGPPLSNPEDLRAALAAR